MPGMPFVIRLMLGDCRMSMRTLPAASAQLCVTSPPYFGLRDYGLPPLVWGGEQHEHEWGELVSMRLQDDTVSPKQSTHRGNNGSGFVASHQWCRCGAWLGSLGLEPTPELYIEHLSEVFSEVWRVLRPDGCVFLNLGDSYAGSGKGPTGHNGIGDQERRQGFGGGPNSGFYNGHAPAGQKIVPGYKAKDLMLLPWRVALALQSEGWWIRSVIPWLKRNSMPESVQDRPATATEYVFLLAKSARYFWDADAVRQKATYGFREDTGGNMYGRLGDATKAPERQRATVRGIAENPSRSRRNSDWWFESWQGLLLDEQDEPIALVVNPQPFKESHFATFPPKLVEPMIKAGTSEKGCCPECDAPWRRVTEHKNAVIEYSDRAREKHAVGLRTAVHGTQREPASNITTGWQPTCTHGGELRSVGCGECNGTGWIGDVPKDWELNQGPFDPIPPGEEHTIGEQCPVCSSTGKVSVPIVQKTKPCVVLDPFAGSGTVGLVADRLGRDAILLDVKPDYGLMSTRRVVQDAPLFVQLEAGL